MEEYEYRYKKLNDDFMRYQVLVDTKLDFLVKSNKTLEKKLSTFIAIAEVSKYLNSNLSNDNLLILVNNIIVEFLEVKKSTIHSVVDGVLKAKVTNIGLLDNTKIHYSIPELLRKEEFIRNDDSGVFLSSDKNNTTKSIAGVPIIINDRLIGFIVVEHDIHGFLQADDLVLINYLANQIALIIENNFLYEKIKIVSCKDSFLGIYNRKYFYEIIESILKKNPKKQFAVVMSDIDDFKLVNDTYGHQFGDIVIKNVVSAINNNLDNNDFVARYGGEEFIIYIDDISNLENVLDKIDSIRKEVEEIRISLNSSSFICITVSFGIGLSNKECNDIDKLVKCADDALYKVKKQGKNKIEYKINETL